MASIDIATRTVVVKPNPDADAQETIAYRDDTKYETAMGGSMRLDEFTESSGGRLPIAVGEKVRISWRTSADGKTRIALTLRKTP